MDQRKTKWLVLLAAGLFTFIFFYERKRPGANSETQAPAKLLPSFSARMTSAIEIVRSNLTIRVVRTNDAWALAPSYPAQTFRIQKLLTIIETLPLKTALSEAELVGRPQATLEYGLNPPQARVLLRQPNGPVELLLGYKTLPGDNIYLQVVGRPGVFFADSALWNSLPAGPADWRDTAFLCLKGLNFDRLELSAAPPYGFELLLNPSNRLWRLTKPTPARADNAKVNLLLEQLRNAQISRFLMETSSPDPEMSGLQPAAGLELAFARGSNTLLVAQFGRSPTNDPSVVYARTLSLTGISPATGEVVCVPAQLLAQLRVPFREFQDRRLVRFSPDDIDFIEVRARESFALQRQTNAAWRFTRPTNREADPVLVREFVTRLADLDIVGFEKDVVTEQDFAAYGFAPPTTQYTLWRTRATPGGATNELLAQIDFGTNIVDRTYTRRHDENSLYAVSLFASQHLPVAAFQLRDRNIWNFAPTNVSSLTIYRKGQTRKIVRNAAKEWTLAPVFQGRLANPLVADMLLLELGKLRAQSWVAQGDQDEPRFGFPIIPHQLTLEISSTGQPLILKLDFGGPAPSGNVYAATVVDGQRTVFEFPASAYQPYEVLAYELFEAAYPAATQ
jgi:hypothetical protein